MKTLKISHKIAGLAAGMILAGVGVALFLVTSMGTVDARRAHVEATHTVPRRKAIELESGLSLKRSQANQIIQYRNQHGPFKSIEDLKKVPGIDAEKIEAKKERLIFNE